MPIAHLYQIVNKVTGEFYTGVHKGHQQDGYWGSGIRIKRSIKKYGKENFDYRIWIWGDIKDIYEMEKLIVNEHEINNNPLCLNLKVGGYGGTKINEATREKLSGENNHFFGKTHSEETKEKLRKANLGRKHSPEIAQKRIEKHIDKYRTSIAEARKHIVVKEYTLKNPSGEIVTIKGYNELKKYGNPDLLSAVSSGKKNTYKGWSKA
jgi:hypothetical protein